ncbi:VIT1/CCC1 transporter family protein [Actibacterium sp. XHP0104]|uniref:VIT1/CCC1 transporter family protein n=1 Tax=Actibacterium sp. XHP0104 TaxID=2984335 RepID=UPI0021E8C448|nr:VIT1/CCC1 transporter family protein [Actibacterium sp. XHP0104]MCV2881034.1 VIT1/CCC1 transporter family protein [Actibacterium sp. XHP0104]
MAKSPLGRIQDHLKQIVYGGNDGIVTTFAIVAGFAGANADGVAQIGGIAVILFGLANLFSDAVSMGLGDFLSSRSQDKMFARRKRAVVDQITADPDVAFEELTQHFGLRGLDLPEAQTAARALMSNSQAAAHALLDSQPGSAASDDHPALSGLITFGAFVVFGALPLLPYLIAPDAPSNLRLSVLSTLSALILLGLMRGLATGERLVRSVGETVLVGGICAAVAFVVGLLVGA